MYSVTDGWKQIEFVCCNRHKEPQKMQYMQTPKAIFYACPKYFPQNREENEPACVNAIYTNDAEKAVDTIHDRIGNAEMNDENINLTNYAFTINNVEYKVLSDTTASDPDGKIVVSVLNRKVKRD